MIKIILLVCSAAIARADCNADTATDVIMGPSVSMPTSCALFAMSQLGSTSIEMEGHYLKVQCTRQITPATP
jgi:hypothetical protein